MFRAHCQGLELLQRGPRNKEHIPMSDIGSILELFRTIFEDLFSALQDILLVIFGGGPPISPP